MYKAVLSELKGIGYQGELLQESYPFEDWFLPGSPSRIAPAVAFAQTPLAYDTACFAVLLPNDDGRSGADLVNDYRALGAPRALEVHSDRIVHWRVSTSTAAGDEQLTIWPDQIRQVFSANAPRWRPENILRAKNIAAPGQRSLDFIDLGLIPALEEHIRAKLDPLLRDVLHSATKQYEHKNRRPPNWDELYRLVFRALAGKIMHDRGLPGFDSLSGTPDAEHVLEKVATFYNDQQRVIADVPTQRLVVDRLWKSVSFKNLSVEVLAFIWENTLVTDEVRERLGIHATPPSIAKYIVHRLPIEDIPEEQRRIVEPCCGSATFLVAALQRLRDLLSPSMSPKERHKYFTKMLSGFDIETFGLEVARSCLMLADFPNPNGWVLKKEDVFESPEQSPGFYFALKNAGIVLCNPPFEPFKPEDRPRYLLNSVHKPVELLQRVLAHLPPHGLLGFVLPRQLLSGASYREIRRRLAERYSEIEVVSLPDKVFEQSEHETALLIAKQMRTTRKTVSILNRKVDDKGWPRFRVLHEVAREDSETKSMANATGNLGVVDLHEVWSYLSKSPTIDDGTGGRVHRGIEWNISLDENRSLLIAKREKVGYKAGIPSVRGKFYSFECPPIAYLCVKPEYRRGNAFDLPWDEPKVIMNAKRKSRTPWRIAACVDKAGLVAYQTFTCLWPTDEWPPSALAAILNGPVANAFVAAHEGNRDITVETVKQIPLPQLSRELFHRIDELVTEYAAATEASLFSAQTRSSGVVLHEIDMAILQAYGLPKRLERALLGYFKGYSRKRPVPFDFEGYKVPAAEVKNGQKSHAVVADEEDDERAEIWEQLRTGLDEERASCRKLFP